MATKLFVGNLSFQATTAGLEALFGQVGAVTSATIISDKFSGQSRGFGFVEMGSHQEAQTAIERFSGSDLQGRALTVNEAKPQEGRGGGHKHEANEITIRICGRSRSLQPVVGWHGVVIRQRKKGDCDGRTVARHRGEGNRVLLGGTD